MKMSHVFKQLKKEYLATLPSELLREHGWEVLKARMEEEEALGRMRLWFVAKKPLLLIASVVLLVIFGSAGTVYAAQSAKPGDRLYPVKIASERIAVQIAPEQWKDEVTQTILNRRVDEAKEAANTDDEVAATHAQEEYARTVESLRSAGALTSEAATKAAEKAKETIETITKNRPDDKGKPSKQLKEKEKEKDNPAGAGNVEILQQMTVPRGSVVPTMIENKSDEKKEKKDVVIPPIPSVGL